MYTYIYMYICVSIQPVFNTYSRLPSLTPQVRPLLILPAPTVPSDPPGVP